MELEQMLIAKFGEDVAATVINFLSEPDNRYVVRAFLRDQYVLGFAKVPGYACFTKPDKTGSTYGPSGSTSVFVVTDLPDGVKAGEPVRYSRNRSAIYRPLFADLLTEAEV
jgi:hypothetical protein